MIRRQNETYLAGRKNSFKISEIRPIEKMVVFFHTMVRITVILNCYKIVAIPQYNFLPQNVVDPPLEGTKKTN
jgi:hypothetical protein